MNMHTQKQLIFLNHQYIFRFRFFSYQTFCIKIILNYVITEYLIYHFSLSKMAINGYNVIHKLYLICILCVFGATCPWKRSIIMGVIIDKIFIIIYNISQEYWHIFSFPIHLLCLPKCVINMLLVLMYIVFMYKINVLFRNRKSYFDLKPLRCWFMTNYTKYYHISIRVLHLITTLMKKSM